MTSYVASAAAADTLSELRRPSIGMLTIRSQRSRTSRDRPAPSAPSTRQMPSTARSPSSNSDRSAASSRPTTQMPASRQRAERGRQPGHDGDRHVLDGPRRGLGDGRRDVHGTMAWHHHAVDPGAVAAADDGAQVAGIGDPVDGDEERRPAASLAAQDRPRSASGMASAWRCTPCGASLRARPPACGGRRRRCGTRLAAAIATMSSTRRRSPRPDSALIQISCTRRRRRAAARGRPGGPRPARRRAPCPPCRVRIGRRAVAPDRAGAPGAAAAWRRARADGLRRSVDRAPPLAAGAGPPRRRRSPSPARPAAVRLPAGRVAGRPPRPPLPLRRRRAGLTVRLA